MIYSFAFDILCYLASFHFSLQCLLHSHAFLLSIHCLTASEIKHPKNILFSTQAEIRSCLCCCEQGANLEAYPFSEFICQSPSYQPYSISAFSYVLRVTNFLSLPGLSSWHHYCTHQDINLICLLFNPLSFIIHMLCLFLLLFYLFWLINTFNKNCTSILKKMFLTNFKKEQVFSVICRVCQKVPEDSFLQGSSMSDQQVLKIILGAVWIQGQKSETR